MILRKMGTLRKTHQSEQRTECPGTGDIRFLDRVLSELQ
jgi:hypothetical protein